MVAETDDRGIATSPDGIRYVFLQGHPEYFADTLLREYRRDVRRFLSGAAEVYPTVPQDYLSSSSVEAAIRFSVHAKRNRLSQTAAAFPEMELDPGLGHAWEESANVFATNWMSRVAGLVNA
jgi:homoserine O-succinyltransferase